MRPRQLSAATVSSADAIDLFMNTHRREVHVLLRALAHTDEAMEDELEQSVRITLWQNDASRFSDHEAGLLLHRIDRRARDARKAVRRRRRLGGRIMETHADLAACEANAMEPRYMRRARGERFDPQDPCTENL